MVGVKDRSTNKIAAAPVPETTAARLGHFIEGHVKAGAKKYTDENPSYRSLSNHESCNHSVGAYVRGQAHTNDLESFWSMMKRGYDGVFHHMSEPHLHRYVNEFAGRHNIRNMDPIDMMGTIAEGMAGSRLTYRALIAHSLFSKNIVPTPRREKKGGVNACRGGSARLKFHTIAAGAAVRPVLLFCVVTTCPATFLRHAGAAPHHAKKLILMCRSCLRPYNGKYLQQCPKCGHPMHDPHQCTVGMPGEYHTTDGVTRAAYCTCA